MCGSGVVQRGEGVEQSKREANDIDAGEPWGPVGKRFGARTRHVIDDHHVAEVCDQDFANGGQVGMSDPDGFAHRSRRFRIELEGDDRVVGGGIGGKKSRRPIREGQLLLHPVAVREHHPGRQIRIHQNPSVTPPAVRVKPRKTGGPDGRFCIRPGSFAFARRRRNDCSVMRIPLLFVGLAALSGCGGEDGGLPSPGGGGEIPFAASGSFSDPAGKGSFTFGAASAATQIEDQNPTTDWYLWTQPKADGGLGHGDVRRRRVKGYEQWLAGRGAPRQRSRLDSYRFSIEWARIEPQRDVIDEAALAHYSDFIDALLAARHSPSGHAAPFSNPVWVDDPRDIDCLNGPSSTRICVGSAIPSAVPLVIEEMRQHAELLAERFGDRVDDWGTLNEPVNYLLVVLRNRHVSSRQEVPFLAAHQVHSGRSRLPCGSRRHVRSVEERRHDRCRW